MADFTEDDKAAIDDHLRTVGVVQQTDFGDQRTTFRPLDDVLKLRNLMRREAAPAPRMRSRFASFNKGF